MTWLIGRLLVFERGAAELEDCSLEEYGGVLAIDVGVGNASSLIAVSRGMFCISTRSSSSSSLECPPFLPGVSFCVTCDHLPSGSTVTCSTDCGVDLRMSSTYLVGLAMKPVQKA